MATVTSWGSKSNGCRVGIRYNNTLQLSSDGSRARVKSFEILFSADQGIWDTSNDLSVTGGAVSDSSYSDPFNKSSSWSGSMVLKTVSGQWRTLNIGSTHTSTCKASLSGISYAGKTLEETVTIKYPAKSFAAPAVPSSSSFSDVSSSSATLNAEWASGITTDAPLTSVRFEYTINDADWVDVGTVTPTVTGSSATATIVHSGISTSYPYRYRVTGVNSGGDGESLDMGYLWLAPAAPTAVDASRVSDSDINVTWTNNGSDRNSVANNKIWVSIDDADPVFVTTMGSSLASSYKYTDGTADHYYSFYVVAFSAGGETVSSLSPAVLNTISPPNSLTASSLAVTTPHSDGYDTTKQTSQVTLSWSHAAPSFIDKYEILVGGSKIGETTGTTFLVTGLPAGIPSSLAVRAVRVSSPSGASANSAISASGLDTLSGPPSISVGAISTAAGKASLTLSWPAVPGATKYHVRTILGGGEIRTPATPTTGTTMTLSNMSPGTQYKFSVHPLNAAGYGPGIETATITTPTAPGVINGLNVTYSAGMLNADWAAPDSNGGSSTLRYEYKIETQASSGAAWEVNTDWTSAGLTPNFSIAKETVYNYRVSIRAVNGIGPGEAVYGETGIIGGYLRVITESGTKDVFVKAINASGGTKIALVRKYDGTNWVPVTYS